MFEKGSFPWGEIGAWLLEIGREIPSEEQREARNKGAAGRMGGEQRIELSEVRGR